MLKIFDMIEYIVNPEILKIAVPTFQRGTLFLYPLLPLLHSTLIYLKGDMMVLKGGMWIQFEAPGRLGLYLFLIYFFDQLSKSKNPIKSKFV